MSIGRLYQLFGAFCVFSVYYFCWKQAAGLKYRKALPATLIVTFLFITIHFKNISNPLATYAAIGLLAIPAVIYGLLYRYELLLIIAAIYIPHNAILPADFGGIQQALNGTNIVLGALILGLVTARVKGRNPYSWRSPTTILVVIFCIVGLISFVRGGLFFGHTYMRYVGNDFKRFITPMILFLLFVHTIPDKETIKIIVFILMLVVIMALFLGLLEWVDLGFGTYSGWKKRLGGLNKQPNAFGAFIAFYICLFFSQFLVNFKKIEGKMLIFPFLMGVRLLIPSNSRGAWIAFPPAVYTVSFFRSKLFFIAVIFLSLPFIMIRELTPSTVLYRFKEAAIREELHGLYPQGVGGVTGYLGESQSISMRTRAILWTGGIKLWRSNPFWGRGYWTFSVLVSDYAEGGLRGSAHNFWLQILCEMGVVAMASIVAVLFYFFKSALFVYKREKDPALRGFSLGYLGIIPAIVVANMTGDRFNHVDLLAIFWMLSACIISLKAIIIYEHRELGMR